MQKLVVALGVAFTTVSTAVYAAPENGSVYTGAKVGWSAYHSTGVDIPNIATAESNQLGAGAFLGYQVSPYFALETGYDWFGRMPYNKNMQVGDSAASFKAQGIQLGAKLSYPMFNNFDIYTRLGAVGWRAESQMDLVSAKANGISPMVAVGAEYAMTDNVAARLDYQWVDSIGKKNKTYARPDNGMLTVGISYRFGQSATPVASVEPVEPIQQPEVVQQEFTLNTDVLFEFNKSNLTSEGMMALDQLVGQLKAKNTIDGSVFVLGYADRIGSEKYNLALSERRSQSVVKYLLERGISSEKITSKGMGQTNSLTVEACYAVKGRIALLNCLSSDRRVEVQVNGIAGNTFDVVEKAVTSIDENSVNENDVVTEEFAIQD